MILVLKRGVSEGELAEIRARVREDGCTLREIKGVEETVLGVVGKVSRDIRFFEQLPGVAQAIPVSKSFKLVSREMHPEDSVVRVGPASIGGERLVVIAGPCAVESREQALTIAREVARVGATMFRGGAFKPRTSPYSFQGLMEEGLKILAEVREETGLPVVTEMTSPLQADLIMKYVDMVQVGARNMQNFELLKSVGRMGKPVLLKRGLSATIEEWLMSAEYILSEGNDRVVLCERGIRTFETYTRNTLDLTAVPAIKKLTHLPIIIDPSHATGIREMVGPMARSAVAAGADGLMVEVHHDPENALSDGPQSLYPAQFERLMRELRVIATVVERHLGEPVRPPVQPDTEAGEAERTVCYMGEPGSFSHRAARRFFEDDLDLTPVPSFREVFRRVAKRDAEYGVVPLENSITGSIHENFDLITKHGVKIAGEITLRVVHNLLGLKGASPGEVRRIFSHPQVFEQCREFLESEDRWELRPVASTALACRLVAAGGDPAEAAIAGKDAADIYGLSVMKESVETNPRNFTRFAVVSLAPIPGKKADKSSLILAVPNRPGALYDVLKVFAQKGINLSKLESRPVPENPFEYMFYVDIDEDAQSKELEQVIADLADRTSFMELLGTYERTA